MTCPTPRSGRYGFVGDYTGSVLTRYSRFQNWNLDINATPESRVYSGTRFGTQRVPGPVEYVGSFQAFGATPPLFVGDSFTFLGYAAPTSGVACTPGCTYVVPALVDTLTITWNWTAENRSVFYNIGFSSNGTASVLNYDDPCDDDVFCDTLCDLDIVFKDPCDNNSVVEFCNITQAVLSFTANTISYSNNSTNCEVRKVPGNLDWTLEVTDQNPCIIPTMQMDYMIEIDATPTTKWSLEWGMHTGIGNYRVDAQTGDIISKVNRFAMQAVLCCTPGDETPQRGQILHPDGTVLWPYATPSS